jgi:CBS domain-containing protein
MIPLEQVPTLRPDEPLFDALGTLSEASVGRGLVLEGTRLLGLLSVTDLARALEVGR